MLHVNGRLKYGMVGAFVLTLCGCTGYVKQSDFNAAISELRSNDQKQQQEIDAITQEMHDKFAKYDAQIAEVQGRIRVETIAHFDTNQSTLRDEDKPLLDDYAKVMREHHSNAVITAEGFADPSGSAGYNHRLALKRAEAVRDYLVHSGGLNADQVRAVSYGESKNRQVVPGAKGDKGMPNRRVSLVTDFAGSS
jgi:peptidoglycan-associated lipoprotein